MEYMDLLTLQSTIKDGLTELFPEKVWVKAEIAAVQARMNGHCYLDLVQSEDGRQLAKVKAVIWKSKYPLLRAFFKDATGKELEVGQQVLVLAEVNYSELYGLSLVVDDINPEFTVGDAELRKQQTIKMLQEEGMMDLQQELVLAVIPYKLAVISAPDAAGFGDFKRHLTENQYGFYFEVDLFPATMQGDSAPESIADALGAVEAAGCVKGTKGRATAAGGTGSKHPGYDAVLILRGGGSNLDLACFDDYGLALAIAQCPIPVFTAIGHDRDYHVADMVAYRFVKTPTALADEFIQMYMAEDERIGSLGARLARAFAAKIQQRLSALDELDRRIKAADPRAVLSRGYTLAVDANGRVIKSAAAVKAGDSISIMLSDGILTARIEKVTI
ncbi:MAG: exodeoxyribonuclease VII large subunit [Bacteroidales bacterium]|nr:exodeoxyribonuclease VII large subunit [Bacteroidales bacterium]